MNEGLRKRLRKEYDSQDRVISLWASRRHIGLEKREALRNLS